MGLLVFKILGASWATYRLLCERLGGLRKTKIVQAGRAQFVTEAADRFH